MFTTTSNYDFEASYQQTSLTGAVAGWFTISESSTSCNPGAIAFQADAAPPRRPGTCWPTTSARSTCFPPNVLHVVGHGNRGREPLAVLDPHQEGKGLNVFIVAHEMGHNYGLYHSHSLDGWSDVVAGIRLQHQRVRRHPRLHGRLDQLCRDAAFQCVPEGAAGLAQFRISPPLTTVQSGATPRYSIGNIEAVRSSTLARAEDSARDSLRSDQRMVLRRVPPSEGLRQLPREQHECSERRAGSQGDRGQRRQQLSPRHDAGDEFMVRRGARSRTDVHRSADRAQRSRPCR